MAGGFQSQPGVIRAARRWSPKSDRSLESIFQKAPNIVHIKHFYFGALAAQTSRQESSGTRFQRLWYSYAHGLRRVEVRGRAVTRIRGQGIRGVRRYMSSWAARRPGEEGRNVEQTGVATKRKCGSIAFLQPNAQGGHMKPGANAKTLLARSNLQIPWQDTYEHSRTGHSKLGPR